MFESLCSGYVTKLLTKLLSKLFTFSHCLCCSKNSFMYQNNPLDSGQEHFLCFAFAPEMFFFFYQELGHKYVLFLNNEHVHAQSVDLRLLTL